MTLMPAAMEASAAKVAAADGVAAVALNCHLACSSTLIVYKQFSCINTAVDCASSSFKCIAAGASALQAVWDERTAMLQLSMGTPVKPAKGGTTISYPSLSLFSGQKLSAIVVTMVGMTSVWAAAATKAAVAATA